MNKTEAGALNREIQAAIKPILESHGLALTSCTARFDDSSFNVSVKSKDPNAAIPTWDLQAVGLPEGTRPGIEFPYARDTYTFTGVNLRASKFPILATRSDGKSYKLPRNAAPAIIAAAGK